MKLRTNQIKSTEITAAMDEITTDHSEFAEHVARANNIPISHATEAIATHIVTLDLDFDTEEKI